MIHKELFYKDKKSNHSTRRTEYPQFNAVRTKMKQYKYLYRKMLDKNIILQAYKNLRKGKTKRVEIKYIDQHLEEEIDKIQTMIYYTRPEFENTPYYQLGFFSHTTKPKFIKEHNKVRKIYMPEIHEQWIHHIIVLLMKDIILNRSYVYSCGSIPGRGAHYAKKYLERVIQKNPYEYCFKGDIKHFYNSIKKKRLLKVIQMQIKDDWFIYVIKRCLINFHKGIPLGFYISQWFANYFLEDLDRYILLLGCKAYVRYMDDIVVYSESKESLQNIKNKIAKYLCRYRHLKLKNNWQVFRVMDTRPIDFMGFKFYNHKTTIRKNIMLGATRLVKNIIRLGSQLTNKLLNMYRGLISYYGWFKYTNTRQCYNKYIANVISITLIRKIISSNDKQERRLTA